MRCDLSNFIDRKDLQQIRTGLRQAFMRSKYKAQFLRSKRVETIKYKKDGEKAKRPDVSYKCVKCLNMVKVDNLNVDHIKPIGSFTDILKVEEFFFKIFCEFDNLQILCKPCHKRKTKYERANF